MNGAPKRFPREEPTSFYEGQTCLACWSTKCTTKVFVKDFVFFFCNNCFDVFDLKRILAARAPYVFGRNK